MKFIPLNLEYIPLIIDNTPWIIKYIPLIIEYIPLYIEYISWIMQYIPLTIEYIPLYVEYIALIMQYIPLIIEYIQLYIHLYIEYTPWIIQYIPLVIEYIPPIMRTVYPWYDVCPTKATHGNRKTWRHQMETFSVLLAICAGNPPEPVNSPHKGQRRGALMFFYLHLNIRLSKQSWGGWFETQSRPLWRQCNDLSIIHICSTHPFIP